MSGQSIHDIQLFTKLEDSSPLGCLKMLLETRHICPSAPDTLRCFPYRSVDPFVIEANGPDVLFTGCQSKYQAELLYQDAAKFKTTAVKLICVPTFAFTHSIVLLDLETLQSYELGFSAATKTVSMDLC